MGAERAVQMCISVEFIKKDTFLQVQIELYKCVSMSEFIKKDTFVQAQKELYKCVSLSNSSRKTHLYRRRKNCTNVYLCRIHQERHICTGAKRIVQMCISVEFIISTGAERAEQMCISLRIHQERHICRGTEIAVKMCISVEFIKKDTFLQVQKDLYKCVFLSNSSRRTHLCRRRKSFTNVYLCQIHQERHICTGTERALQMCISVEFMKKHTFVQVEKEL